MFESVVQTSNLPRPDSHWQARSRKISVPYIALSTVTGVIGASLAKTSADVAAAPLAGSNPRVARRYQSRSRRERPCGVQAGLDYCNRRLRRSQEIQERCSGPVLPRACGDGSRKHRDMLDLRWQRPNHINARNGQ
jgi:hypothetical protein